MNVKTHIFVLLAVATLWAEKEDRPDFGGTLGLQAGILTSYGATAEVTYRNTYAIRLDYYSYSEFQGLVPREQNLPYQEYQSRGIDVGFSRKFGLLRLGAYTGADYVTGLLRGEYLRSETTYGIAFGGERTEYGEDHLYEEVRVDAILFPLKLSAGIAWNRVGIDLGARFYYHDGLFFFNTPLSIRFGWL